MSTFVCLFLKVFYFFSVPGLSDCAVVNEMSLKTDLTINLALGCDSTKIIKERLHSSIPSLAKSTHQSVSAEITNPSQQGILNAPLLAGRGH